jgi:hypothetical protein
MLFGSGSVFMQDMLERRLAIVEPDIERIHPERHGKIAQQNLRALAVQRFVLGVLQFNDVPPLGMFLDVLENIACGSRRGYWIVDSDAEKFAKLDDFLAPRRALQLPEPQLYTGDAFKRQVNFKRL